MIKTKDGGSALAQLLGIKETEDFGNAQNWSEEKVMEENRKCKDDSFYEDILDNAVYESSKIKEFIYSFIGATIKVGKKVLQIGKLILNYILRFLQNFPGMLTGLIFGFALGVCLTLLISSIPFFHLGSVLGPAVIKACTALGGIMGLYEDLRFKLNNIQLENDFKSYMKSSFGDTYSPAN